jgi:hypothetical protein
MESRQVSGKQSIHYRNYRRARDRALARLSKLYPNVYRDLLEEERELDEQEGTVWSLVGDGKLSISTQPRESTIPAVAGRTDYESPDESYDGGEA